MLLIKLELNHIRVVILFRWANVMRDRVTHLGHTVQLLLVKGDHWCISTTLNRELSHKNKKIKVMGNSVFDLYLWNKMILFWGEEKKKSTFAERFRIFNSSWAAVVTVRTYDAVNTEAPATPSDGGRKPAESSARCRSTSVLQSQPVYCKLPLGIKRVARLTGSFLHFGFPQAQSKRQESSCSLF